MALKKYSCNSEHVPFALRFALASYKEDWADFIEYAPAVFNTDFVSRAEAKILSFEQLIKSADVQKNQKMITNQSLPEAIKTLNLQVNSMDGYLKLCSAELTIKREDFGLSKVHEAIHTKDVSAIVSTANSFLTHIKSNEATLISKGMKQDAINTIINQLSLIENLKGEQHGLKNKTSRVADSNIDAANELWDIFKQITDTGTALYKGLDPVKAKEYTISNILKRVKNSQTPSSESKTDTAATTK